MKTFEAQVTLMTTKTDKEVWTIWTDMEHWPKWDDSIKVEINGEFQPGSTITCYSANDTNPRLMDIISVKEKESFTDRCELQFGSIKTYHTIKSFGGNYQITHKMLAEIDDSIADMFGKDIWPNIHSGIFEALNRLINL